MNYLIWNLFIQTGNVETYLLLKSIENEQIEQYVTNQQGKDIATFQTKM